jgi:hypothetical protein
MSRVYAHRQTRQTCWEQQIFLYETWFAPRGLAGLSGLSPKRSLRRSIKQSG